MDQEMSKQQKEQFEVGFLKKYAVSNQQINKQLLSEAVSKFLYPPPHTMNVQFQTRRNLTKETEYIQIKLNNGQSNSFLVGKKLEICHENKKIQLAHLNLCDNREEDIILQYLIKDSQNYFIKDISIYYEVYTFLRSNPQGITYQIKETWPNLQENSQNQQFTVLQQFCKSKQDDNPCILIEVSQQQQTTIWIVQYQKNQCFKCYQQIKLYDKLEWEELKYQEFIFYNRLKYIQCYWNIEEAVPHYKCLVEGDKFRTSSPGHYEVEEIWPKIKETNKNNQNILQNFCIVNQNQYPCILIKHSNSDKPTNWIIQYQTTQFFTCYQKLEDVWKKQNFESFFKNILNYRGGMWILEGEDLLYKLEKNQFYIIQNDQQFLITKDSNQKYEVFVKANFKKNLEQEEPQQMHQEQF